MPDKEGEWWGRGNTERRANRCKDIPDQEGEKATQKGGIIDAKTYNIQGRRVLKTNEYRNED